MTFISEAFAVKSKKIKMRVGKKKETLGYNYFASFAALIAHGPLDRLDSIWMDDELVWEGPLTRTGDYADITIETRYRAKPCPRILPLWHCRDPQRNAFFSGDMNVAESPIRLAIVEDDRDVREGLALFINNSPGYICVAACSSAEDALQRLPTLPLDIVLMDIQLPGMSGIDCIRQLKRQLPATQIMMLTVFEDHDRIFQSLTAGATGYLLKQTPPTKLIEAITDLHQGGSPMSAQIARRVVQAFQPQVRPEIPAAQLSPREQEIIQLLAHGQLYKEIADRLKLSVETVRTHIRNIYQKLHVRSRTEAVNKVFGRPASPVP